MLKLIGICILLFTSILISRELVARRRRALLLCEELLRLVSYLRLQIGCFLRPLSEAVSGFESAALSEGGFLPIGDGVDLGRAFRESEVAGEVGDECARIIDSLLFSLGSGYLDDEVKLLEAHRTQLCQVVEARRIDTVKQTRLIRTLTATVSLGFVILIM
ncbi:MAG: hypothetical protein J6Q69_03290 [Clostridia bacterium]|nr:hypothetical protein [Clostridia bacterium]